MKALSWAVDQALHMTATQGLCLGLFLIAAAILGQQFVVLVLDDRRDQADQEREATRYSEQLTVRPQIPAQREDGDVR